MARKRIRANPVVSVAVGGALGSPARYGVAQLIHVAPGTFPWATFWTNISGAFALGIVVTIVAGRPRLNRRFAPFVATGFLGAYTTFSTFSVETDVLIKDGHAGIALSYVFATIAVGLFAAAIGVTTARRVARP